jgi:hypothetical protein
MCAMTAAQTFFSVIPTFLGSDPDRHYNRASARLC